MNTQTKELLLQLKMTMKYDYTEEEYTQISTEYEELRKKLTLLVPAHLVHEFDEFLSHRVTYEGNLSYEQGFKDGANLIIDILN